MEKSSKKMDYEKAAVFRDRIKALTQIQSSQHISSLNLENAEAKCYNGDWPSTDHYSDKDVIDVLESILNINGSKIVGQDTVFLLWVVMKLATDRMTLLNLD